MRNLGAALLLLATTFASPAAAEFPDKPVRLIVPQAAGSATDTVARILGLELGKELGQQIIVDNRPGGALTIGLDLTAKAEPDGYTICMGPIGALAITRHMVAKLPYDIERDFQPIALVARGHMLLAVAPDAPFKTVPERACGAIEFRLSNITSTRPAIRSLIAAAPPRYGMCTMSVPLMVLNSSPPTWPGEPLLDDAFESLPGFFFA